jgi:hypothetical protein
LIGFQGLLSINWIIMIGKLFVAMAMMTLIAVSGVKAQSSVLSDIDNACVGIASKNSEIQMILMGVRPTGINPSVGANLPTAVTSMGNLVSTTETNLGICGVPALVAMRGQLSAAQVNLINSSNTLLGYIAAGDVLNACAAAAVVSTDSNSLTLIASDIRAEIQKTKGRN